MVKKILIVNHPEIQSLEDSDKEINILKLKHPKSDELRSFALISNDLYEFISLNQDGNSLFIDDYVQSDYQCVFATKFDFRYFLISVSLKNQNEYISIEDVKSRLVDQTSADENVKKTLNNFFKNLGIPKDLDNLFDVKNSNKIEIKYNQEKCLDFLKIKVESLQKYLEKISSEEKPLKDSQIKSKTESYELICQYLSTKLVEPLRKHLGLSSPFESNQNTNHKRTKTNDAIVLN